jgi:hypothetical protein
MGLRIHTLEVVSPEVERDYYVYILDYGWSQPLSEVIKRNLKQLEAWASKNGSVIITGLGEVGHFDNQVLSWHGINGQPGEESLPAILITRTNPRKFKEYSDSENRRVDPSFKYILVPLIKVCKTENDVMTLVTRVIYDIENKKDLNDFRVLKELNPSFGRAFLNSIILEPNFNGVGFSFNRLRDYLK